MKKYYSFLFLLSLLVISCNAPVPTESAPVQETVDGAEPTQTQQEALASPQALAVESATALPSDIVLALIDSPSIINIEMINERDGWGVTDNEIVRTDDGGVTWYNVTPQGLTETGYSVVTEFLDAKNAWLQFADNNNYPNGGTIYKTNDGGVSWQSFQTPFSAGDLEFIDKNNGWILADLGVGAGSMAVSVFQTNDGGETWNRVYTNDPNLEGASETLPLGGIKVLLVPLDMQTAWIGGVIYANGTPYLFRSDDSGKTWLNINVELPQEASESQITVERIEFISRTQGVLVLRMTSTTQTTLVYSTKDGGDTWQAFSESIPEAGKIEIPSTKEVVVYSSDQFYITNDAGNSFDIINSGTPFSDTLLDISFVNSRIGWAIASSDGEHRTLYRTEDGGASWNVLIP